MFSSPSQPGWEFAVGSATGASHLRSRVVNQDSVNLETSASGDVVCAVVSDGAGSAPRSQEGSSTAVRIVASTLRAYGESLNGQVPALAEVRAAVERAIEEVRQALASANADLAPFHCTLVLWLVLPGGEFVAGVGDSAALSTCFASAGPPQSGQIDLFPPEACRWLEVQRGEYANETHFLTQASWKLHLRVHRLDRPSDAVILMSDGAMDVTMTRGRVHRRFLSALVKKALLIPEADARGAAVTTALADERTFVVTADDKTLLIAVRRTSIDQTRSPLFLDADPSDSAPYPVMGDPALESGRTRAPLPSSVPPPLLWKPRPRLTRRQLSLGALVALAVLESAALCAGYLAFTKAVQSSAQHLVAEALRASQPHPTPAVQARGQSAPASVVARKAESSAAQPSIAKAGALKLRVLTPDELGRLSTGRKDLVGFALGWVGKGVNRIEGLSPPSLLFSRFKEACKAGNPLTEDETACVIAVAKNAVKPPAQLDLAVASSAGGSITRRHFWLLISDGQLQVLESSPSLQDAGRALP